MTNTDAGATEAADATTPGVVAGSAAEPRNVAHSAIAASGEARPAATSAMDAGASAPRPNTVPAVCANCGAHVSGRYCSECGQRVEHALHSVWHFACEAAEDLTHADSRLWRTLTALLFKPGFLTQEFLAGRRASYLPPLRLYLVLSVSFFLLAATLNQTGTTRVVFVDPSDFPSAPVSELPRQAIERARQRTAQDCAKLRYTGPWQSRLGPALRTSCQRTVEDGGRGLTEGFFHNLPRALFLTVPALALVMVPLYLRSRRYYIEHLLFVLHDHAFVFALLGLFSIVAAVLRLVHVPVGPLEYAVCGYIPCYYYLAMRRVYGQSRVYTLAKLIVLALAYLVAAILVLLATALYTVVAQ